jgi:Bacterial Ig-like domain (group 3).
MKAKPFIGIVLLAFLFCGCEDITNITRQSRLESITVDTSSAQTAFVINNKFSSAGLVIYGHYSDNTIEKEPLSLASFKGFDSSALAANQLITVSYKDMTAQYAVSIVMSELKSITITSKPKLIYNIGEKFDTTGMVVIGSYSDGSTADVTGQCSIVNFDSEKSGQKLVSVVYTGSLVNQVSAVLDVYVTDKTLKGISVTVVKSAYAQNENMSSSDITVYGKYNDAGTDTAVLTTYEVLGFDTSAVTSSLAVTIKVNSFTVKYNISVQESLMTGIKIASLPTKTIYGHGEALDISGLLVQGIYADGKSHDTGLTGYTVSALDTTSDDEGVKELTVTYSWKDGNKFTTTFQVAVTAAKMTSISVVNAPTEIYQGETLNLAGIVIGYYTNNTTCQLSGFTVTGYSADSDNAVGIHTITVTYDKFVFSFKLTIKTAKLTGVQVFTKPTKLSYYQGESFDSAGMQMKWTYTNGIFLYPQQSETLSYTDISGLGTGVQEVVVSVNGNKNITASVYIEIKKILSTISLDYSSVAAAVQADGSSQGVSRGAALDLSGLIVSAQYTDGTSCTVSGYSCTTDYVALSAGTPTAAGTKCTVTVSYSAGTVSAQASFKIMVGAPVLKSISVSTLPDKMTYIYGDSLDLTGMVLSLGYTDGAYQVSYTDNTARKGKNSEDITITPDISALGAGYHTCTVSSSGVSTTFNIQIIAKLTGITLDVSNVQTSYPKGTNLDLSGLGITAEYTADTATTKTVTDYTYTTTFNSSVAGKYKVSVTVTQKNGTEQFSQTSNFDVTVTAALLVKLSVKTPPANIVYGYGNEFNPDGMMLEWTYSDGTITSSSGTGVGITYPSIVNYLPGYYTYTFNCLNANAEAISASVTLHIVPKLTSITCNSSKIPQPANTGDALDLRSLEVTANYNDGTSVPVTGYTTSYSYTTFTSILGISYSYADVTVTYAETYGTTRVPVTDVFRIYVK